MTRILLPFTAVVAALSPLVSAGIKFTSPKAGDKIAAGGAVTVKWEEGGTGPKLADLTTYELQVIVGGNDGTEQFPVGVITTSGAFTAGNTASGRIETSQSEDLKDVNAYFIKMIAVGKTGGQLLTPPMTWPNSLGAGRTRSPSITCIADSTTNASDETKRLCSIVRQSINTHLSCERLWGQHSELYVGQLGCSMDTCDFGGIIDLPHGLTTA